VIVKRCFAECDPYSAGRPYTQKSGIVNTMQSALRDVSRRAFMTVIEPSFSVYRRKMMDINGMPASLATRPVAAGPGERCPSRVESRVVAFSAPQARGRCSVDRGSRRMAFAS